MASPLSRLGRLCDVLALRGVADNQTMEDREAMRLWVETWKRAGPELEAIRRREIRELDTLETIACLEGAFNYAVRNVPPRTSSGLVDLHEWLAQVPR